MRPSLSHIVHYALGCHSTSSVFAFPPCVPNSTSTCAISFVERRECFCGRCHWGSAPPSGCCHPGGDVEDWSPQRLQVQWLFGREKELLSEFVACCRDRHPSKTRGWRSSLRFAEGFQFGATKGIDCPKLGFKRPIGTRPLTEGFQCGATEGID